MKEEVEIIHWLILSIAAVMSAYEVIRRSRNLK
jgi:hypothetical protein